MQIHRHILSTSLAALLCLTALIPVLRAAPQSGSSRLQLNPAQRLTLPESIEVLQISPADRSIWFVGLERDVTPAVPAVYSWSPDGLRRFDVPLTPEQATTQTPSLAVSRAGEAVLLAAGKLYQASEWSFGAMARTVEGVPTRIVGGEGFWILTASNDVYRMDSLSASPVKVAHTSVRITATAITAAGDLWFATEGGRLALLKRDSSSAEPLAGAPEAEVTALLSDASDQLWASYADGRVARLVAGAVDWFTSEEGLPDGIAARSIVQDKGGNYLFSYPQSDAETPWLVDQSRELRSNLKVTFRRTTIEGVVGAVRSVAIDALGGTWISVGTAGAFRLEGLQQVNWPRGAAQKQDPESVMRSSITRATALNAALPKSATALTSFPALPGSRLSLFNTSKGLPWNNTSCVVTDNLKNVYFTTGYTGFGPDTDMDTQAGAGVIKYDHRVFSTLSGLPSTTVQACAWDAGTNSVWFGSDKGLSKYNPATGTVTNFLNNVVVMKVVVRGAEVFAATWSGVFRMDTGTGNLLQQYTTGTNRATSIAFSPLDSTMFVGTGGASTASVGANTILRWTGAAFVTEPTSIQSGNSSFIHDIEFDNAGNLWIAQRYGSHYRRSSGGVYTEFKFGPDVAASVYRAYHINKDSAGNIWYTHGNFGSFGTNVAGATMIPAANVGGANPGALGVQYYNTTMGLPNNSIMWVGQEAGAYWFASPGNGAWRIGGPLEVSGWPKSLIGEPGQNSPLLVDLDQDGKLDVIVADMSGRVYAYRHDGTSLWTVDVRNAITPISRGGIFVGSSAGAIGIQSSAAAGDVDGDGDIDVVIGVGYAPDTSQPQGTQLHQGGMLILSRSGAIKRFLYTLDIKGYFGASAGPGLPPKNDGFTEAIIATPVLANIDNDPELEILAGALDNFYYAWNGDGSFAYERDDDADGRYGEDGLSDTTPNTPFDSSDDSPGILGVDDNGDGIIDNGSTTSDDDEDGRFDEDYPVFPFAQRDTVLSSTFVWDINGDGTKEIVFGGDYTGGTNMEFGRGGVVRVLDPQGRQVSGFPIGNVEQVIWSTPVAVDLNNDGQYEILHGTGPDLSDSPAGAVNPTIGQLVYAWKANGTPYIGANVNGRLATTVGRSTATFAVGDLDNDNVPELIIVTQFLYNKNSQPIDQNGNVVPDASTLGQLLYAFRVDGSLVPGFPVRPVPFFPQSQSIGSPVLADVDGDGFLDIIVPVGKGPIAFDRNGHVIPGMGPFEALEFDTGIKQIASTPALADVDNDGNIELIWTMSNTDDTTGLVRMVRLGATTPATYNRSFPQWLRTVSRNPVFGAVISLVQGWETAGTLNIRTQAFAGRNPLAAVTANLTALGGSAAQALSTSTNAYFTTTFNVAGTPVGRYEIPITITDGAFRTDTQTLVYIKRGATRTLLLSPASINFGTATQGGSVSRSFTILNSGNAAMTLSSVTSSSTEFVVGVQNGPVVALTAGGNASSLNGVPIVFSWTGTQLPRSLAAGESIQVTVRFRPGAAVGARAGTITINSDDAAGARTIAVSGSTATGAVGGCAVTVSPTSIDNVLTNGATRKQTSTVTHRE